MEKNFLPISLNIAGQKILIIGGGQSAFKKIKILQRFNAEIEVLANEVCAEIKILGIRYYEQSYHKDFLRDYVLVYSCTNNAALDKQIVQDGKKARVLINIHDQPALCDFVSPAIFKHGNITIAVGSNATDVYASIRIRDEIEKHLKDKNVLKTENQ